MAWREKEWPRVTRPTHLKTTLYRDTLTLDYPARAARF